MRYLIFAALTVIIVALLTAAFWDYTQDDVFITYAYSRNLVEGNGFVFNPGERVQGTTTPLYTLIMAGVEALVEDMLHAGNLLSAIFLLLACLFGVCTLRPWTSLYAQAAFVLIVITAPIVYVSFGMETLFYCFLLLLAFWLWTKDQRPEAMIAAAALTWTRADGVVLGGTLWLAAASIPLAKREKGQADRLFQWFWDEGIKLGLIYAAGIAPWYLFALAYFGTPFPNTFGAKQEFLGGTRFWSDGWTWWESFYQNNPLTLLAVPLIVIGFGVALRQSRLRPVGMWAGFYALGYTLLNVTAFWYYTPWFVTLILLAALGGDWLAHQIKERGLSKTLVTASALVLVILCSGLSLVRALDFAGPPGRVNTYKVIGQWINAHTPESTRLLIGDLGIMGYYAQRHTIDSPGLIVPEMYERTDAYATAKYKPDLIVGTGYYTWVELTRQPWFQQYYVPLAQFSTLGDNFSPMTVYQRRYDLENPLTTYTGLTTAFYCRIDLKKDEVVPPTTRLQLIDDTGEVVLERSDPFLADIYPQDYALGVERLHEQMVVPVDFAPGLYLWQLDCDQEYTGRLEVRPIEDVPLYTVLETRWDGIAELQGVALLSDPQSWSGGTVQLVLDWAALAAVEQDYSVLVHLVDSSGRVWAQGDGYPRQGTRPTTSWQADEEIVDVRSIALPPDLPAGEYTVLIGWYDPATLARIPTSSGEDAIPLPFTLTNQFPGGSGLP